MKKVLIVDDDTIVRVTLRSLISWEQFGYEVAADAVHGGQALKILETEPVDLLITDMKMPVLDGLGLIEAVKGLGLHPQILVLSGYDDYKLVREAFRLGALDYILKSDLTAEGMEGILQRIAGQEKKQDRKQGKEHSDLAGRQERAVLTGQKETALVDVAMGRRQVSEYPFPPEYMVVQFEIDDYRKHAARFSGNLEERLIDPFMGLARQIPRVAARCVLGSISPSRYLMLYEVTDRQICRENVVSACRQLANVWRSYMNLPVSAGISSPERDPEAFSDRVEEAGRQLGLRYLKGSEQISVPWNQEEVSWEEVEQAGSRWMKLLQGLWRGDELVMEEEREKLFGCLHKLPFETAVRECLCLICRFAWMMQENQEDFSGLFAEEINYYEKMKRFEDVRELERWMSNYFRWLLDYQENRQDRSQENLMMRAKRFILDNYSNPELTLGSVAGYVGLNEKYFTTRFTKEEGQTFINYLTEVRIRRARELMEQTSLKIYEISQSVGYNNVEHFTRVFKKQCGVSPGSYRSKELTKDQEI
ncbi:MAG: response regulator [Eubacteriales bacterium]|nr:response regulator [Eubacteriales bacterium]